MTTKEQVIELAKQAEAMVYGSPVKAGEIVDIVFTTYKRSSRGDFASNVEKQIQEALAAAKAANKFATARSKRAITDEVLNFDARGLLTSLTFWHHLPVEDADELADFLAKYMRDSAANAVQPQAQEMRPSIEAERKRAEIEYSYTAHNYPDAPIGSRDWTLYWAGWLARSTAHPQASEPAVKESLTVPEGWKLVPVEPTPEMLGCIVCSRFPEDWEAGKALQMNQRGESRVPFKTEYEIAVGQYQRMLAAAPEGP